MQFYGIDWLAVACNLTGIYLLGNRSKYGFASLMAGAFCWIIVGFMVSSFPLIGGNLISFALQIRGLLNWRKENK